MLHAGTASPKAPESMQSSVQSYGCMKQRLSLQSVQHSAADCTQPSPVRAASCG